MKALGFKFIIISFVALAWTATSSAQTQFDDTNLLVIPHEASAEVHHPQSEAQTLEVKIDPSEVHDPIKDFNREQFIRDARDNMTREPSKEKIEIWVGPRSEEALQKVLELTDTEIASFLGKKKAFLTKFANTLTFFRISKEKINKALMELNNRFYESSHVVSRSNTKGVTIMASLSAGLALPQKLVQAMKQRSIGKYIPESGGFYYMLGIGAGFSRRIDENKRSKFVFEIFMDVERLKSTLTGIVEVSAAGTYGLVFEQRNGAFTHQQNKTMYGGATGVFRQGTHQFGWAASTGLSIPPGIGAFLVYQDTTTRYYLFRAENFKLSLPALSHITTGILTYFKNLLGKKVVIISCSQVF